MTRYKMLIEICQNELNSKNKDLIELQDKLKNLNQSLSDQYNVAGDSYYIDMVHLRAAKMRKELVLLEEKIEKVRFSIKEKFYKKKRIEKLLKNCLSEIKKNVVKKEIVDENNIATINYSRKNLVK
ncbi:MAG: hypothetical protein HRK26_05165 [Rickettsiaceae bacterium H1]|nr:hypothetical protein [Rickettsiaceae bacterium H1]